MRGVRTVIACLPTALALSGCARGYVPVNPGDAVTPPQSNDAGSRRKVAPPGAAPSPGNSVLAGECWFR